MNNDDLIKLYVNVDKNLNVIEAISGNNIIPEKEYCYFFIVKKDIANNIGKYHIEIVDFIPQLKINK